MSQTSIRCRDLTRLILCALTASDPLGQRVSSEENQKANASLWEDLQDFKKTAKIDGRFEVNLFHGAGFLDDGTNWEEKVFYFGRNVYEDQSLESKLLDFVESNFPSP